MPLSVRATIAWCGILLLAFINGGIRELLLIPRLGERAGHALSSILLSTLVLAATWFLIPWIRPADQGTAWRIGLLWLGLTLAFEFLAGHYLFGSSWDHLLADYNIGQGRIWVLVLLTTLVAPALTWVLRAGRP